MKACCSTPHQYNGGMEGEGDRVIKTCGIHRLQRRLKK